MASGLKMGYVYGSNIQGPLAGYVIPIANNQDSSQNEHSDNT